MNEKFWMVWLDEGWAPKVKHKTLRSALDEANRLANKMNGRKFYVMAMLGEVVIGTRPKKKKKKKSEAVPESRETPLA